MMRDASWSHRSTIDQRDPTDVTLGAFWDDVDADTRRRTPPLVRVPYPLREFQEKANYRIDREENVIAGAHTGSGKTLLAKFACEKAFRTGTRAFVVAPLIALCVQLADTLRAHFETRDDDGDDSSSGSSSSSEDEDEDESDFDADALFEVFNLSHEEEEDDDEVDEEIVSRDRVVGLFTGDSTDDEREFADTKARVIVATPEILLLKLLGHDNLDDVSFVIFDEAHFLGTDRGHVYEMLMMLLPKHITFVLLSATMSNMETIGLWLANLRDRSVYMTRTDRRATISKYFLYTGGGDDRFVPFYDTNGQRTDRTKIREVRTLLRERDRKLRTDRKEVFVSLVRRMQRRDMLPAIHFVFDKRRIHALASMLESSICLLTKKEASRNLIFFNRYLLRSGLSKSDRSHPQIVWCRRLVMRGIGVHHSGLLVVLKEIMQMLATRRGLKFVLATDTIAWGINMPVRTGVHDASLEGAGGKRMKLSHCRQIWGRAGRPGYDDVGFNVFLAFDRSLPSDFEDVFERKSEPVRSQFLLPDATLLSLWTHRESAIPISLLLRRTFDARVQTDRECLERIRAIDEALDPSVRAASETMRALRRFAAERLHDPRLLRVLFRKKGRSKTLTLFPVSEFDLHLTETRVSGIVGTNKIRLTDAGDELQHISRVAGFEMKEMKRMKLSDPFRVRAHLKALSEYPRDLSVTDEDRARLAERAQLVKRTSANSMGVVSDLRARRDAMIASGLLRSNGTVTSLGRAASQLPAGDGVACVCWLTSGGLNDLASASDLVAILSTFICNGPRDARSERLRESKSFALLRTFTDRVNEACADAAFAWCASERTPRLADVDDLSSLDPGNLVRDLQRTLDYLRQVSGALVTLGMDARSIDLVQRAKRGMQRGILIARGRRRASEK